MLRHGNMRSCIDAVPQHVKESSQSGEFNGDNSKSHAIWLSAAMSCESKESTRHPVRESDVETALDSPANLIDGLVRLFQFVQQSDRLLQ